MATHHHGTHSHAHAHGDHRSGGSRRLILSILLNLVITIAEIAGGLLSGSLALLSDALHNFSDTASLIISYVARRVARREANRRKTFGYKRAEVIGAFVNLVTLVLIAFYLMKEAIERLLDPQPIDGSVMLVVAVIGLVANVLTALLLYRHAKESLNLRSAFLHIVSDAASSVGVVVGGFLIIKFNFYLVDPLLTLAISLYILYHSYHMLRQTVDILMEGTPSDLDLEEIVRHVHAIDGVRDMHHLHVWQLDEAHTALEAHIGIDKQDLAQMEKIKQSIKARLAEAFNIEHSTLEFEFLPCQAESDPDCYEQAIVPDERAIVPNE